MPLPPLHAPAVAETDARAARPRPHSELLLCPVPSASRRDRPDSLAAALLRTPGPLRPSRPRSSRAAGRFDRPRPLFTMPYFSLIEKRPDPSSDEDEMDDDSDSYPDLETCPKQPRAPATPAVAAQTAQDHNQDESLDTPTPPARSHVLPDWKELLFGGREKMCDSIYSGFSFTYSEDCEWAETTALNHIANLDIPVLNGLRDVNQHQVTRALKLLRKGEFGKKRLTGFEEVLAYLLMLDYVSCCCQEGKLFALYDKCKDERKRCHIDSIDTDLASAIQYLKGCSLEQMQSAYRLVEASIHRIPSSLHVSANSTKYSFKRKLSKLEREEKNKNEDPIYHFSDNLCSPVMKKFKPSVTATTKSWKKGPIRDQNTSLFPFSPKKQKKLSFITKPQLDVICTPSEGKEGEGLPVSPDDFLSTSTPRCSRSPRSSYFLKELFMLDEDESPRSKRPNQVSRQLLTSKENVSPIKNGADFPSSTLSGKRALQTKSDMKPVSSPVDISTSPQSDGYASDDSLPDVPIDLKSYVLKRKNVTPIKSPPVKAPSTPVPSSPCSSGGTTSASDVHEAASSPQKTSIPKMLMSPYKSKLTMWNSSKYDPLVKSSAKSTAIAVLRSPLKATLTALKEQRGNIFNAKVLKSPLKEVQTLRFQQNDNGLPKSSKLQDLSRPNGVQRICWFQFRKCVCGKCKHGDILAVRLVLPVKFNSEEAQNQVSLMVKNNKKVKCRCGNCVPKLLNEENKNSFNF